MSENLQTALRDLPDRIDVPTPPPTTDIRRRGNRRRWIRRGASGALIGVAITALSFVQHLLAPTSKGPAPAAESSPATFASREAPWTFEYPSDWGVETTRRAGPELMANMLRTTVVNGSLPESAGEYGPNSGGNSEFTSDLGDAGAVVLVERFWSHGSTGDESRGPGAFVEDAQSPGWTFRERLRCGGTLCFSVVEWLGPAALQEDQAAAASIADSVRLADVERWTETDGERTTLHDEDDLFTVTYPVDWIAADERINTWVDSPFEILALATYQLRPGGEAVIDAQVPSNAIDDLGPNDIFIWVNDGGDDGPGFPDRPDRFEPSTLCGEDFARFCPDPEGRSLGISGIRAWWLRFGDSGRGIYAFVGMGEQAFGDAARAQLAWDVLNSLHFLPR